MNDPNRREDPERTERPPYWAEPTAVDYPLYPDPAYAGQQYPYSPGYPPPPNPPTAPYWQPTQTPEPASGDTPPPEPPRSPRWLWLAAGAAVLLVIALVAAVLISNSAGPDRTAGPPLTTALSPTPPARTPTLSPPPSSAPTSPRPTPSPSETPGTTPAGATQTVVYRVSGDGRALSIAYVGPSGALRTDFDVPLPWSKEVSLDASTANVAMVTVITTGAEVTCSLTVDGQQVRERTGTFVTICAAAG